jgi:hypothetical protein
MSGGAHDSARPPRPGSPVPPPSDFPVGRPLGGDESRADVRWVRRCGGTFQTVARRQAPTVRKQRSTGDARASPRAAAGGNRYTVQRSLRGMSRTDVRWGPRFCSTAPGQDPPSLLHQISLWPEWCPVAGCHPLLRVGECYCGSLSLSFALFVSRKSRSSFAASSRRTHCS